ncbi:MAG: type VI secretion system baseplate subunit TssE [Pseudomonadota bacterium]
MASPLERYRLADRPLRGSLLDRLIDDDPSTLRDPPVDRREALAALREALRRDLELLLNTRCPPVTPPADLEALPESLSCFGTQDFFAAGLATREEREALARALEHQIARFEPRLVDLGVSVMPTRDPAQRMLRLRIQARFTPQPGLPALVFQTQLDPTTQRFTVRDADDG